MKSHRSVLSTAASVDSTLSVAERIGKTAWYVLVTGGGVAGALLAKADPILKSLGPIYWYGVGLLCGLVVALSIYLLRAAAERNSNAELLRSLAVQPHQINPLPSDFQDRIIRVEDLRLPVKQAHERKHFRRCVFVGPAALAIAGGTLIRPVFSGCGDVITVPEAADLTGIVGLIQCTLEDCEFVKVSLITNSSCAKDFAAAGMRVMGND